MAAWLIPALKAVLPHVGTIISAATPVFTKKKENASVDQIHLLQQQVSELQFAVSQNAEHIKDLAAQLQSTVTALEQAASDAEVKPGQLRIYCVIAIMFSAIALSLAILVFVTR